MWLYLQLPLAALVLWRSSLTHRFKVVASGQAAVALLCFFVGITIQAHFEVSVAPRVTSEYLTSIFAKNDGAAIARLIHKRAIVTGKYSGFEDPEVSGPGSYQIDGSIQCLGFVGNTLSDGDTVSIIGTLETPGPYDELALTDSRVVK